MSPRHPKQPPPDALNTSYEMHLKSRSQNPTMRQRRIPPPLRLGSISEEDSSSEYYMNLGAETPVSSTPNLVGNSAFVKQWAEAGVAVPRVPARRTSLRALSAKAKERERSSSSRKDWVDRDCGICFEYAVVPCRTLCCGKIFCTEHLADWLHGPNAEGLCPNCENVCSLEGGTLSLATPSLLPSSQVPKPKRASLQPTVYPSSPLSEVQPHQNDTLTSSSPSTTRRRRDGGSTTSSSSTTASMDTDSTLIEEANDIQILEKSGGALAPAANASTTPFSTSWGAVSRLVSLLTFLMFVYKLLS
ncbi:hypothetical protein D9613_006302 [Agrocybe pediades]|uniref:RING-type domain-containing protein n=1 Tax=Agrocybe pediades TaxID=84607 RepID=A0A8H4QWV3_9AGAR|nr:hypothetical protein D9613_006302 [Agrocybe pediades]KAF9564200.1 hypothetical protein CPC08DRAFT_760398 [Agrocybe pediades]